MKILEITNEKQGKRVNDFCFAEVGEIAKFGTQCSGGKVDDKCACSRSMVGVDSAKASTTVKVVETKLSLAELTARLANNYIENWKMTVKEAMEVAHDEAEQLVGLANSFNTGSVLEIRGSKIATR